MYITNIRFTEKIATQHVLIRLAGLAYAEFTVVLASSGNKLSVFRRHCSFKVNLWILIYEEN